MDINEVKSFIEENNENEEVKSYISSFQQPLSKESVIKWTQDGEGRSWLDSTCDIYSRKAIETAKKNVLEKYESEELPNKIQEALNKASGKTPEQLELEKTIKENKELNTRLIKAQMVSELTPKVSELGLPVDIVNYVIDEDQDKSIEKLNSFKKMFEEYGNKVASTRLNSNSPQPPKEGEFKTNTITKEEFLKMSYKEKVKLHDENPELYKELKE